MTEVSQKQISDLMASGLFDPEWYRARYPDVDAMAMDPALHYLHYGHRLNRDPGPSFSTRFARAAYKLRPEHEPLARLDWMGRKTGKPAQPDPRWILKAASLVALAGDHARAIDLAQAHLPADLAHTAHILEANAAVARADDAAWQGHVNSYLGSYGVAPVRLEGSGTLFERLGTDPLPPVTGGPLISVIMPAWNAEKTVRKAAQSILDQTWRNLELLIVDDCSTDATWPVLQRIAAADSRVKILRNKVNVGPYVSKNIALREAQGVWFTGHDADDWAHPQRLEKHLQHLFAAKGKISASRGYMLRITETGEFSGVSSVSPEKIDGVLQRCGISAIYDLAFFHQKIGSYDCSRFGADNELVGRVKIAIGRDIDEFQHVTMFCQNVEGSLTNNPIFGIGGQYGATPGRTAYKSAWQKAHAAFGDSSDVRYPFPPSDLPFHKPSIAEVPAEAIRMAMGSTALTNRKTDSFDPSSSEKGVMNSEDFIISRQSSEDSSCLVTRKISKFDPCIYQNQFVKPIDQKERLYQRKLQNIVFVISDISTIGGVPNRTRIVLSYAAGREIDFHAVTLKNEFSKKMENVHCFADDPDKLRAKLAEWSPLDTVFVVSNNTLKSFTLDVVQRVEQFPIVYFSAGQMAFFIQNSTVLMDLDYVSRFRAMKIISLSDGDIKFQQQLGIFGQIKGIVPVTQRAINTYTSTRNRRLGYVGRIDFRAKDCMRLIDVAKAMKGTAWMPIQVFTTDGKNSPEYAVFRQAVAEAGLEDQFEFIVNCTDKDRIYRDIGALLLPSKMEGFGNVVVEAFSYGIPVIAASYAPGPAEAIEDGKSGFLLDTYTGANVRALLDTISPEYWRQMSDAAFQRHKRYSLEEHVCFLEKICAEVLDEFLGENLYPVFPTLQIASDANRRKKKLDY